MKFVSICAAALSALLATAADAAGITPVGTPFRIDSGTGLSLNSTAAMRPDGSFVAAWQDQNDDVRVRRYANGGTALGADFAASTTPHQSGSPQLSVLASGDFAVAWIRDDANNPAVQHIYARLFHADGTPLGAEFRLDDDAHPMFSLSLGRDMSIALGPGDQLMAAWTALVSTGSGRLNGDRYDMGVFVRRFNAAGTPLDGVAQNIATPGADLLTELNSPSVSASDDGRYLVAWTAEGDECLLPAGVGCAVELEPMTMRFRRLDSTGKPTGAVQTVPGSTVYNEGNIGPMQAAASPAGNLVVAWVDTRAAKLLHSQAYGSGGLPRLAPGADVPEKTFAYSAELPAAAINVQGNYAVALRGELRAYVQSPLGVVLPAGPEISTPLSTVSALGMSAGDQLLVVGQFLAGSPATAGTFGQLYSLSP